MRRILQSPRDLWCAEPVTATGLLVDGDDYYRAFYEAAEQARSYILLSGWQFDENACLLRGEDADHAKLPVQLRGFLDALCERTQNLRIYILAWDFHSVFLLEREWMQSLRFNWMTNERMQFHFDSNHADRGSHHQKFVVIDGWLSFLGGLDLCDHRWDDRKHHDPNPLRVSRGAPHKPFHDVQAYLVGNEVAAELAQLFVCRWQAAGGDPIVLPESLPGVASYEPRGAVALAATEVALSRTDPFGAPTGAEGCREICDLHLDAIATAQRLIYIETQYFTSQEISEALVARLRVRDETSMDVVLVLNMEAETLKEEIAVGLAQARVIGELRTAVQGTRHRLGIYYTVPATDAGVEPERATYIHSKIMIVDDRFLTIGSANLTNRSQCVDTELNMSVETLDAGDALGRSLVRARRSLIAEHLGVADVAAHDASGLVATLDDLALRHEGRLRIHPSPTEKERAALELIDPRALPFDPAAVESQDHERSIFVGGLGALWTRLTGGKTTGS
jgi:phospholipase D1/2